MRKFVIGIESTAHTCGVGIASLDSEIILDFSHMMEFQPGKGIHPREAAEHHSKVIHELVKKAVEKVREMNGKIAAIGFARGPGLGPCLRVGATVARALSLYFNVPLYGVHHGVAHIEIAKKLTGAKDPLVVLVSGGHTMIIAYADKKYRVFGETLDITLGNLLDMCARMLGFSGYGGPIIEKLAKKGRNYVALPYVVKGTNLSFAGILAAVQKILQERKNVSIEDLAYSIQETAFAMLCEVAERALAHTKKKEVLLCGGVAANKRLQTMLKQMAEEHNARFYVQPKWYGDNGAMIAWTTVLAYKYGKPVPVEESYVWPMWRIDEVEIPWVNE